MALVDLIVLPALASALWDVYDLRRTGKALVLFSRVARATAANEQLIAIEHLEKASKRTLGAQALRDLFSLDSLQVVVLTRHGQLPPLHLLDPFRKMHLAAGRLSLPIIVLSAAFMLSVAGQSGHEVAVKSGILGLASFMSLHVAYTIDSVNQTIRVRWGEIIQSYIANLGGRIEGSSDKIDAEPG